MKQNIVQIHEGKIAFLNTTLYAVLLPLKHEQLIDVHQAQLHTVVCSANQ